MSICSWRDLTIIPIIIIINHFHNLFKIQQVKGAVTVQMMVRSDLASSGVAFTLDPDTGFRDVIVLTGSWGLGESVVGGKVCHINLSLDITWCHQRDTILLARSK